MQINPVSFYKPSNTQNAVFKTKEAPRFNFGMQSPIGYALTSDQLSFTGKGVQFFLKDYKDIPCPCCGVKMVRSIDIEKLSENVLGNSSEEAVKALSEFEENMHPTEKACFQEIKELSKENPLKNLQELVVIARPKHYKPLRAKEFNIINQIDVAGKGLSEDSYNQLMVIIKNEKDYITGKIPGQPFKRKTAVKKITALCEKLPEKDIGKELVRLVNTLPTSSNDVDAFFVKYFDRTSTEIGQRLVIPSRGTFEHIKADSAGGSMEARNGLYECDECNFDRGNMPFNEFVMLRPEMPKNTQKSMDVIIEMINNGEIKGNTSYPVDVARTLKNQSKGLIVVDTSKLKVKPASSKESEETVDETVEKIDEKYNPNKPKKVNKSSSQISTTTNPFAQKNNSVQQKEWKDLSPAEREAKKAADRIAKNKTKNKPKPAENTHKNGNPFFEQHHKRRRRA